jgi:hypothetical protein
VQPTLAWIVVYPDANEGLFGGPDVASPAARVRGRCPAYSEDLATRAREL